MHIETGRKNISPEKVYHLSKGSAYRVLITLLVVYVFIVIVTLLPSSKPVDTALEIEILLGLGVFFLAIGLPISLLMGRGMRLSTSPEGIINYGIGYRVYTPWDNLSESAKMPFGYARVEGLVLRVPALPELSIAEGMQQHLPALEMSPWFSFMLGILPFMRIVAALGGRYTGSVDMNQYAQAIPVGQFDKNWRSSELGQEIRRYAPQVFA